MHQLCCCLQLQEVRQNDTGTSSTALYSHNVSSKSNNISELKLGSTLVAVMRYLMLIILTSYLFFEMTAFIWRHGVRLGNDWDYINFIMQPLHELYIKGCEAMT